MDTKLVKTMLVRTLYVLVGLLIALSMAVGVSAQEPAFHEGNHDGAEGIVNAAGCSTFGWAVDPDNRDRDLQVQIFADGNWIATTTADLTREDVEACPDGTCGFGVDLWGLISAGQEHQITVQTFDEETGIWMDLWGTPKTLTCLGVPEGFHDGNEGEVDSNSCGAFGWAADPDDRDRDLQVQIIADESVVAVTTADLLREDVGACIEGTCGFGVDLWNLVSHDEEHQITAQAYDEETGEWFNLEATPKTLYCQSPPPTPWFTAFPEQDIVEGWDWPLGTELHMLIDDPATENPVDYEQYETVILAPWGSGQFWVWFEFPDEYDMKPGDVVTLSDGINEQTHIVRNLSITAIAAEQNTVIGTSDANENITLWSWEDPQGLRVQTTANNIGAWRADFDEIGFDLVPDYHVRAEVWDESGNDTAVDWYVHPSYTGLWRAVDVYDDSNMQMTISGFGNHLYQLTWTDDYWSICGGRGGIGLGTGSLNPGGFLQVDWVIKCRGVVVWENQLGYWMDLETGTLWDGDNTWYPVSR